MIVHLGELEEEQRLRIWLGHLARANIAVGPSHGIFPNDVGRWASERLNGRAILHLVRPPLNGLAQSRSCRPRRRSLASRTAHSRPTTSTA